MNSPSILISLTSVCAIPFCSLKFKNWIESNERGRKEGAPKCFYAVQFLGSAFSVFHFRFVSKSNWNELWILKRKPLCARMFDSDFAFFFSSFFECKKICSVELIAYHLLWLIWPSFFISFHFILFIIPWKFLPIPNNMQ